jgi:hypothetical protein
VRTAVVISLLVYVLLGAVAPHEHGGSYGAHACAACLAAGAEEARAATPEVAPRAYWAAAAPVPAARSRAVGAPLGAVPGQSPPLA